MKKLNEIQKLKQVKFEKIEVWAAPLLERQGRQMQRISEAEVTEVTGTLQNETKLKQQLQEQQLQHLEQPPSESSSALKLSLRAPRLSNESLQQSRSFLPVSSCFVSNHLQKIRELVTASSCQQ